MKQTFKILTSLVLSASFMLSSLAAPVMVGTVENAAEGVAEQTQTGMADLAADVVIKDTEETVIKEVSFDNDAEGWAYMSKKNSAGEEGMSGGVETFEDRGVYRIESTLAGVTDIRMRNNALDFETSDITKIQVVVKACGTDDYSLKMYYDCNGHGIIESYTKTISFTGDEWATVTFDTSTLRDWTGTLTHIRFVVGQVAETAYYVDSIKFYGYETTKHDWLPGVNILTASDKAITFDDGNYTVNGKNILDAYGNTVLTANTVTSISVVDSPVSAADGKVLKYNFDGMTFPLKSDGTTLNTLYPKVNFNHKDSNGAYVNKMPTDGRPIYVSYDAFIWNADYIALNNRGNWVMSISSINTGTKYNFTKLYLKNETPAWHKTRAVNIPIDGNNVPYIQLALGPKNNSQAEEMPEIYFDNFMYVPYYKVTFMDGTQELGIAYVLTDELGNILNSFDPSLYDDEITMPEGKNAWSLTNGGKATHNVEFNNEDIVVYAVYERTFTPGVNILTKTSEALNFDSSAYAVSGSVINVGGVKKFSVSGGSASIVASPVVGETENKVLKFKVNSIAANKSSYPQLVNFVGTLPDEAGRPVFVGAKLLVGNADNLSTAVDARSMRVGADDYTTNYASGVYEPITTFTPENAPADWFHYGIMDKVSTTKLPRFVMTFKASAAGTASPELYVDDILMVPYYKVTFMNGDTKLGEAWVLDDGKGKILDSFNPVDYFEGEYPAGTNAWSLTKGGKAVESIALENEDITVYAVFGAKNTDNVVLSLDYNDGYKFNSDHTISRVSHHSIKDGKLIAAANIPSGVNRDNSVYKYDSIMGFRNLGLDGRKIKKFVMRAKFVEAERAEEATYLYDENGNIVYKDETTEPVLDPANQDYIWRKDDIDSKTGFHTTFVKSDVNVPFEIGDTLIDSGVEFHFQVPGDSNYYKTNMKSFTSAMADEEGFVTLVFDIETDMANDTHKGKWQNNEISYFRFDFPAVCCAAEIDYIRFYGDEGEKFAPLNDAPEKRDGNSIKFDEANNKTGIRYRAAIKKDVKEKKALTEYGWLVALAQTLGNEELTHEFKSSNGKASYVEGVAYGYDSKVGKNVDRIYEIEDDHVVFTAVVVGVPVDKAEMEIVIRPYSIVNGAYVYGNSVITSPREVAQRIKDKNGDDYKNHAEFIEALLGNRQEA